LETGADFPLSGIDRHVHDAPMVQYLINVPMTAEGVARRLAKNEAVTDEMLLEAAEGIQPRLLPPDHMAKLRKELDPSASRRGRPSRNAPSSAEVAQMLGDLDCPQALRPLVNQLGVRLRDGRSYTENHRAAEFYWKKRKADFRTMMIGLYRQYQALLRGGADSVEHPILGRSAGATENTPRERALELTQAALARMGLYPPSLGRMRNILSEARRPI